jgi:hypothetical protein
VLVRKCCGMLLMLQACCAGAAYAAAILVLPLGQGERAYLRQMLTMTMTMPVAPTAMLTPMLIDGADGATSREGALMRKSMWRAVVLRGTVRAAALGCCGCGGGRLHWRGAADAGQVIGSCGGVGQATRARPPAVVDDKAMVAV